MGKLQDAIGGVKAFLAEVGTETKKATWPGREELIESTMVVIVSVLMMSVYVGLCDKVLLTLLKLVTSLT